MAATVVLTLLGVFLAMAPGRASDDPPATRTVAVPARYRGHSAGYWAWRYRVQTRRLMIARATTHRRWSPTVDYALRLASLVYGVALGELRAVSFCESHHYVFARNGQYRGLFQEGPMFEHGPFAMLGVFDPIANALTAAYTVSREGWRQWECRP